MAQTYKKLNVDINTKPTDIITAVQADAQSRYLDIALSDNGVALNLIGHEVRIYGKKPDGTEFYNDGTITSATSGRCQFELTSQALFTVGIVEVQILLFKDNTQILSTQPFNINVVKSLMSDTSIESSNEYGALVVLYQNLYEAYDLMTQMVQKIGVPGIKAQAFNLETMFAVWDYLIDYLEKNSSAGVVATLNEVNDKIGSAGDISGSTTTGTVMGKLNTLQKKTVYSPFGTLKRTLLTTLYTPTPSRPYKFCDFEALFDGVIRITVSLKGDSSAPSNLNIFRSNHTSENYPFAIVPSSSNRYSYFPALNAIFTSPEGSALAYDGESKKFGCMQIEARDSSLIPYDIFIPVIAGEKVSFVFHSYYSSSVGSIQNFKLYYDEVEV